MSKILHLSASFRIQEAFGPLSDRPGIRRIGALLTRRSERRRFGIQARLVETRRASRRAAAAQRPHIHRSVIASFKPVTAERSDLSAAPTSATSSRVFERIDH